MAFTTAMATNHDLKNFLFLPGQVKDMRISEDARLKSYFRPMHQSHVALAVN